jgi:hypothetical protein
VRFAELPKLFDDWNAEQVEPGPNPKILTHLGDWPTPPSPPVRRGAGLRCGSGVRRGGATACR